MSGIKSRMKDYRRTPKHMVRLPKPASVAKRQLIELSDDEEDDISYQRHKKLLLQEHRKVHPNLQVVTELMRATYKREAQHYIERADTNFLYFGRLSFSWKV